VLGPFVAAVAAIGVIVVTEAIFSFPTSAPTLSILLLAVLTVSSGRITIKVPGHPATVSISEVFVFASVLLFGPSVATVTMAIDGACASITQRDRRLYRALFNIAEPAVSIWVAGHVYLYFVGQPAMNRLGGTPQQLVLPILAMTASYFLSNTLLTAAAVAIEAGDSVFAVWRENSLYMAINYQAAASLAALLTSGGTSLNFQAVGLIVPLLLLSYVAYQAASSRLEDSHRHVTQVEQLYHSMVETLAISVDAKDQVTHGHIRRVQRHTLALARQLGVEGNIELKALEAASLLHDIGKLAVPDHVLNKPGSLTRSEYATMKQHATIGATILTTVEFPYPVVPVVRHHHECWNGSGYPDGLRGEDIPIGARILTVVDCFDAVTSDRPYRRKLTDEQGIEILRSRSGTMYDARVVEAFIALIPALRREDAAIEQASSTPSGIVAAAVPYSGDAAESREASDRLTALNAIGAMIADRFEAIAPGTEACLFTPDVRGDLVPAYATEGLDTAVDQLRLAPGQGLSGWVAVNRHAITNSDPRLDLDERAADLGFVSCTSTPVFALGTLIGVLTVYSRRPKHFSDDEGRAVGRLAQAIAMVFAEMQDDSAAVALDSPANR